MSQAELADLVGVRYQLVSDWERGVYTPRPSNVRKVCRALKCKRADLEFSKPDPMQEIMENNSFGTSAIDNLQSEGGFFLGRIKELEKQVETGTTLLEDMVKKVEEAEARIDTQEEYIDKLTGLLKKHGLDHYIKRL